MARYDLRLTDAEFYDLTPCELAGLFDRHKAAEERLDRRTAQICYIFAAGNLTRKDGAPFTFDDFLPQPKQSQAYNGHVDTGAQLKATIETLKNATNIRAVKMAADDPRKTVDREQLDQFLKEQGLG